MGLEENEAVREPVEIWGMDQIVKGYLDITFCNGERIRVPTYRVVFGEEQGEFICHVIDEGKVFEYPVVKNPGYVTYKQYL